MLTVWLGSEILLPLTTFRQQETSLKTHPLPDILKRKEFNKLISTLTAPEEVTMKLWLEALSLIPESSTSWLLKSVLRLHTFLLESCLIFMMLLRSMVRKVINLSSLQVLNTVQDPQEIGLPRDLIYKESRL